MLFNPRLLGSKEQRVSVPIPSRILQCCHRLVTIVNKHYTCLQFQCLVSTFLLIQELNGILFYFLNVVIYLQSTGRFWLNNKSITNNLSYVVIYNYNLEM